jgi:hypothetical protein
MRGQQQKKAGTIEDRAEIPAVHQQQQTRNNKQKLELGAFFLHFIFLFFSSFQQVCCTIE